MTIDGIPDWAPLAMGVATVVSEGYQPRNAAAGGTGSRRDRCRKVYTGWQTYLQLQVEGRGNPDPIMSL